jgi:peptidoglycan/LPS O-acetylase OafA/YrhL
VEVDVGFLLKPVQLAKLIMAQPQKTFVEVDFLKGISVLMVILFHTFFAIFFAFKKFPDKLDAFISSIPSFFSIVLAFDKAVDIFFMISSFLLSLTLFKSYERNHKIDYGKFYFHRFFRIYPLFLVALLLYSLADLHKLLHEGWYSLLFIENIFTKGIIPVQWSLSVEVQFYLILPLLIRFLVVTVHPIRWILVLIVASVFLRFWIAWSDADIYQTPWTKLVLTNSAQHLMESMYYVIQARMSLLLLGVLWALLIWLYPKKFQYKVTLMQTITVWFFAGSLIYLTMRYPVYDQNSLFYHPFNPMINLFALTIDRLFFGIAILSLILFYYYMSVPSQLWQRNIVNWKGWRLLSELAYPMYFFHFPFIALSWVIVLHTIQFGAVVFIPLYDIALVFLLAFSMTLYLSLWLNYAVESRFIKYGKELERKWFKPGV